jgi:hypothetical protein
MSAATESASTKDLEAQAGFRHRFQEEFRDVTQALPGRLTIFIDDLDRCRPQNVLDALEAVNFLVSSGDCFIVLGIDRDQVTRCVALNFRDVAAELAESQREESDGRDPHEAPTPAQRPHMDFARHYMEKLINIEVKVPRYAPSSAAMIASVLPDGAHRRAWRRDGIVPQALAATLAFALLGGGGYLGTAILSGKPAPEELAQKAPSAPPGDSKPADKPVDGPPSPDDSRLADAGERPDGALEGKGTLEPGGVSRASWYWLAGLPLLLAFGIAAVRAPRAKYVEDSTNFK